MKIPAFIISLFLLCGNNASKAQNLLPSTVRQVFSLEKGDSLEYREWTVETGNCGCEWYELKLVDSLNYSSFQDTLSIFFHTQLIRSDSGASVNQCGPCKQGFLIGDICPINTEKWILTNLDYSIVSFLDTTYGAIVTTVRDSSYIENQVYNGSKQNFYSMYFFFNYYMGTKEIYVDSVGIVYKMEIFQNMNYNTEQLIYYHKANGKTWGAPLFALETDDVPTGQNILVYPNPADNRFIIRSSSYQGTHFRLFDALSRQVLNLNLSVNETEVNRNNLPTGIYFWQITAGEEVMKTGKLVMK